MFQAKLNVGKTVLRTSEDPNPGIGSSEDTSIGTSDETAIEFTGAIHGQIDRGKPHPVSGLNVPYEWFRPEWQKSLRCTSTDEASCEECWETRDCFTSTQSDDNVFGGRRQLNSRGNSEWSRWLNIVHLSCSSRQITVHFAVGRIKRAIVRSYWDGIEVNEATALQHGFELHEAKFPFDADSFDAVERDRGPLIGQQVFEALSGSGHEWIAEVTTVGQGHKPTKTMFNQLEFYMQNEFAECEDVKACLEKLVDYPELRNSNLLQMQCLEGLDPNALRDGCQQWRECMPDSHEAEVLLLLRAAMPHLLLLHSNGPTVTALIQESAPALPGTSSHTICMDPVKEDPESWHCDCGPKMMTTCDEIIPRMSQNITVQECFTAIYCEHPGVCDEWKELACTEEPVVEARSHLPVSLLSKRYDQQRMNDKLNLLSHRGESNGLDDSMFGKFCE